MADQKTIKILQTVAICFAGAFIIFKIASAIGGSNALASIRTQAADVVKNVPGGLVILNLCLDNLIAIAVILLAISARIELAGFVKEGMNMPSAAQAARWRKQLEAPGALEVSLKALKDPEHLPPPEEVVAVLIPELVKGGYMTTSDVKPVMQMIAKKKKEGLSGGSKEGFFCPSANFCLY